MLNNTKKIKELYEEIQRSIFYIIPGKWDEVYLYASIIDRLGKVQTGEMYFYFMPKSLLKHKFVNVYEVPKIYDIEEDEYLKLVEQLYDKIKELKEAFKESGQTEWTNITISIRNNRFKVEYSFDKCVGNKDMYYNHHIYWRYKYLKIEPHSKKEKQAMNEYIVAKNACKKKNEIYETGIYLKRKTNIVAFDTTDFKETQKVEYLMENQNSKKIRNQLLSNKKI